MRLRRFAERYMQMKITKIKEGLITLAFLPLFLYQFVYLISWVAAEPLDEIKYTALKYEFIPDNAQSFYVNHGHAIFNSHPTIREDPASFGLWLSIFVASLFIFAVIIHYAKRRST